MVKGHRSGPTHHPQRLGRESGHLTPLTSKEAQVGSWAGGLSIGGSERQSWEVLSQPLHLGCGWTGGGADSENLWFEEDLCNQLTGKTGGSRFVQDSVDKEAHCFAWRVCPASPALTSGGALSLAVLARLGRMFSWVLRRSSASWGGWWAQEMEPCVLHPRPLVLLQGCVLP